MIRFGDEGMRRELAVLWRECFGDPEEYANLFFDNHPPKKHTLVSLAGECPVSMLSLLPVTAGKAQGGYIYAVATKPDFRRRGLAGELLRAAERHLKEQGKSFSVLTPSMPSLYNYYEKYGFYPLFSLGETIVRREKIPTIQDGDIRSLSSREFFSLRKAAFEKDRLFIAWDENELSYRKKEIALTGGEILGLCWNQARGAAVCYPGKEEILIKELALEEGLAPIQALGLLKRRYSAGAFRLRLPSDYPFPGGLAVSKAGCICWYDNQVKEVVLRDKRLQPYMNLVLD